MCIRSSLSALALALALAGLSGTVAAEDSSMISQEKIDRLQPGASESAVMDALGHPKWVTRWMDGTHSMVYDFNEPSASAGFLYVTFDADGKLLQSEIIENNDGDSESGSSDSGGPV